MIGDTDILQTAPQDLIQAGYGDVVGKITAITDWDLSVKANGDYRCDICVTLVKRALDKCFDKAEGFKEQRCRITWSTFGSTDTDRSGNGTGLIFHVRHPEQSICCHTSGKWIILREV